MHVWLDKLKLLVPLLLRSARRIVILIVGSIVVLIGVAMILLPGPAVIVIPFGISILALEFAWARRLLDQLRKGAGTLRHHWRQLRDKRNQSI